MNSEQSFNNAIAARHSVRAYKEQPIAGDALAAIREKIEEVNMAGDLHVQLVLDEPKAFLCPMARYGKFRGVRNYLVMAGKKADDLDERVGYYGEQIVLLAQTLGLNTCWVGVSYSKTPGAFVLDEGEKVACVIAIGYGETQGVSHKIKSPADVSNASDLTPRWFNEGVNAALLAPTAVNQQRFHFEYVGFDGENKKKRVIAKKGTSMIGYTQMDLGIAKCHFEIAAGKDNFEWA